MRSLLISFWILHLKYKPLPVYIGFHVSSCWLNIVNSAQRITTTMNQEINLVAPGHRTLSPRNRCCRLTAMNQFCFTVFKTAFVERPIRALNSVFLWFMSEVYCSNMLNKRSKTRKGETLENRIMLLSICCLSGWLLLGGIAV